MAESPYSTRNEEPQKAESLWTVACETVQVESLPIAIFCAFLCIFVATMFAI
jgi:hypothetical protein